MSPTPEVRWGLETPLGPICPGLEDQQVEVFQ